MSLECNPVHQHVILSFNSSISWEIQLQLQADNTLSLCCFFADNSNCDFFFESRLFCCIFPMICQYSKKNNFKSTQKLQVCPTKLICTLRGGLFFFVLIKNLCLFGLHSQTLVCWYHFHLFQLLCSLFMDTDRCMNTMRILLIPPSQFGLAIWFSNQQKM